MGNPATGWRLELVPLPGTRLHGLAEAALWQLDGRSRTPWLPDPEEPPAVTPVGVALARAVDSTLLAVANAVRGGQGPRGSVSLVPQTILALAEGSSITGNSHVWWIRTISGRLVRNQGEDTSTGTEPTLLAGRDWFVAASPATIEALSTESLLAAGELWPAVDRHCAGLLPLVERRVEARTAEFVRSLQERKRVNAAVVAQAARRVQGAVGVPTTRPADGPVSEFALYRHAAAMVRLVTQGSGTPVVEPTDHRRPPSAEADAIRAVAHSSALHMRDVQLPDEWWRRDLGPLIGWRPAEGDDPPTAAVLLFRRGRYRQVDPDTHATRTVDRAAAREFDSTATQVQTPLPDGTPPLRALWLGMSGGGPDTRGLLLAGVLAATVGLAAPVLTGVMLGNVTAQDSVLGLPSFAVLLIGAAVASAVAATIQNLRLLRLEGLVEQGVQFRLWDRLIRLPVRFFRASTTGELANAVLGVSFIREALAGILPQFISAALTIVADLMLVFVVNQTLGLLATVMIVVFLVLVAVLGRQVLRRQRKALPEEHRAVALANQMLGGITKIKLAGAEERAYSRWVEMNAVVRRKLNRVRHAQGLLTAIGSALPLAGQLVLFAMLAGPFAGRIGVGQFLAVNAAFLLLLGSLPVLVAGGVEILGAIPRLAVLRPALAAAPERRPEKIDPGDLRGDITLVDVTFGYQPDDPPVLDGVSFHVRPGEFVAIVGPSGCGKSTLLRLLLGFEQPRSGTVLYDDQDLGELDVQAVRRQCGVVLQDGQLFAGSLRENICGGGNYHLDQVWEAARMAGLDNDIDSFPMGMSTMVPLGGGTLSVGQRQRVLIARALIDGPRIVFFDEATSALDNQTQEIVTSSTRRLAATRLVIAHRLSTVVHADRIVVLEGGRIVQEGTYDELMGEPEGLFYRLASRQLVSGS
jgi:NHLM bacteriocin system ABC transporter ATP-binding protein